MPYKAPSFVPQIRTLKHAAQDLEKRLETLKVNLHRVNDKQYDEIAGILELALSDISDLNITLAHVAKHERRARTGHS